MSTSTKPAHEIVSATAANDLYYNPETGIDWPVGGDESLRGHGTIGLRRASQRVHTAPASNASFVGLVGKIGPAFKNGRASDGEILIADPDNDSVWSMKIPGDYFQSTQAERLRAALDHLIAIESY